MAKTTKSSKQSPKSAATKKSRSTKSTKATAASKAKAKTKTTAKSTAKTTAKKPPEERRRTVERRKVQRRRQIDPTTCERDYNAEEIEFMRAMDDYKRASGRMFPTCSEILEVVRALGYQRPQSPPVSPASQPSSAEAPAETTSAENTPNLLSDNQASVEAASQLSTN